jgi:plasmid stability protein
MASIAIRRLDELTKARLRVRAAQHGRSMEAEARDILTVALASRSRSSQNLADALHARFAPFGGLALSEITRGPGREPPTFED